MKEDYVFEYICTGKKYECKFSELFEKGKDTLVLYHMMLSPKEGEKPCTLCASIIDGLDGAALHFK